MFVLPCETRTVFSWFFSLSLVYTNVGPLRVNNKEGGEELKERLLLSLSAKFGVPIRLIPLGICLWWHRCLLFPFLWEDATVTLIELLINFPRNSALIDWSWSSIDVTLGNQNKIDFFSFQFFERRTVEKAFFPPLCYTVLSVEHPLLLICLSDIKMKQKCLICTDLLLQRQQC